MKDLLKIYRRYISTAALLCILIICFNLLLLFLFLWYQFSYKTRPDYLTGRTARLAGQLTREEDGYALPAEALEQLEKKYAFAMLIDSEGQVSWSWNLPEDIPRSYSLTDIASFTRWYLKDYPVQVCIRSDGLFVTAQERHSTWKHSMTFSESLIVNLPVYLVLLAVCNLLLIFLLALLFGHRFYASLKPLAEGIECLADEETLALPEQGITGSLAGKLNQVSATLHFQKKSLQKRDHARTSWISGVSHDIRTPLSLIMGHADTLEQSPNLNPEEQKAAVSIKENSLQIKKLIADLNLTSKLEYDSYPLRLRSYAPAALLRDFTARCLNEGLAEPWSLELDLDASLDGLTLTGDPDLLLRAFRNLTDNSVRHNPQGCQIRIQGRIRESFLCLTFSDTGTGIPVQVIKALYRPEASEGTAPPPHVMGLRIVRQILEAHGGSVEFELLRDACRTIILKLPLTP